MKKTYSGRGIFTAELRGGLSESLETEKPISTEVFIALVKSGVYSFYSYDERIFADRYILKDIEVNYGLPVWINDYIGKGLMK